MLTESPSLFRILVRCSSHIVEGLLPTSCICANKYNETEVIDAIRRELKLSDYFKPVFDEKAEEKLCRLDKVCFLIVQVVVLMETCCCSLFFSYIKIKPCAVQNMNDVTRYTIFAIFEKSRILKINWDNLEIVRVSQGPNGAVD